MTKKKPEGIVIRGELEKELERLKRLLPTKHSHMSKEDWKFAVNQANAKFRTKNNLKIKHLGSKTSNKGLGETIKELQTRLDSVDKHLGTRYLTKGSRKPVGFKTWHYTQDSPQGMINPDYNEEFDPKFIARQKKLASQDFYRGTDLSNSNSLLINKAENNAIEQRNPQQSLDTKRSNPNPNGEGSLPTSSVEQEEMNRARLKASAYLDKVGAGGRMTPQKLQALALVAPNSKTNAHTLAVRHHFRNDPRFKDKAWQKDFK